MTKRRRATKLWLAAAGVLVVIVVLAIALTGTPLTGSGSPSGAVSALDSNPNLDPGTVLPGTPRAAPGFTLTDQFGRRVSLSSYRGKVVILAFNDSECTTVCPLTTTAMVDAQQYLGAAGSRVALVGVDANPDATAVKDVRAYSQVHGMLHKWEFLTAPTPQLERVWKAYGIAVQIVQGQIDHTAALYEIDPRGRLRDVYITQMNYSSVPQLGQVLAQEASSLLPDHPRVHSSLSYATIPPIGPDRAVSLPRAGGGSVHLGPGSPRLLLFFATWDSEDFPHLGGQLQALDRYAASAAADHLPALTAVDEGSVEPSPQALPTFLRSLSRPLAYPVAVDRSGRIADGYEVQDEPWLVLVSRKGQILWYYDVSTQGWLSVRALAADVRAAQTPVPAVKLPSAVAISSSLAGSPAPLAALHRQASQIIGPDSALIARVKSLRGYPIVVNAWASWCPPCQQEFPLFAAALSVRYGRQVAFLGADTNDLTGDARSWLAKHPVSYPSYQGMIGQLAPLIAIDDLPTTIFIDRAGAIAYVHTGVYDTQGTLDQDIEDYALSG